VPVYFDILFNKTVTDVDANSAIKTSDIEKDVNDSNADRTGRQDNTATMCDIKLKKLCLGQYT
jgi:hypothetical protein